MCTCVWVYPVLPSYCLWLTVTHWATGYPIACSCVWCVWSDGWLPLWCVCQPQQRLVTGCTCKGHYASIHGTHFTTPVPSSITPRARKVYALLVALKRPVTCYQSHSNRRNISLLLLVPSWTVKVVGVLYTWGSWPASKSVLNKRNTAETEWLAFQIHCTCR